MSELAGLRDRQGSFNSVPWPAESAISSQPASGCEAQDYARGAVIYSCGEPARHLWRVDRGIVRSVIIATDGRRFVRDFLLPGDVFGFEPNKSYSGWAEAVGDCRISRMRRTVLAAIAGEDPSAAGELLSWMARHCERAAAHSALLARAGAEDRVLQFLVDLAGRSAPERRITLPITRSDIGDYAGLASETVSRAISRLRSRGLITTDRGAIVLLEIGPAHVAASRPDPFAGARPESPR
jgi:CRP/FNR family transcriptional regulator, nitrogen fixation regulation protein